MQVRVRFANGAGTTFDDITAVHFGYKAGCVVFESDINSSQHVYALASGQKSSGGIPWRQRRRGPGRLGRAEPVPQVAEFHVTEKGR